MNTLKLSLQYAHYDSYEADDQIIYSDQAIAAFDTFDWLNEAERSNQIQKVSLTLSLESQDGKLIWLSAVGGLENVYFVSEYSYIGTRKRLFGLVKYTGVLTVDTQNFNLEYARQAILLFASGSHEALLRLYDSV